MATGDIALEATHTLLYEDASERDANGQRVYTTVFRTNGNSSEGAISAVTPSGWAIKDITLVASRTTSGLIGETLFDGTKRYKITVVEE